MHTFSVTYTIKYFLPLAEHYVWNNYDQCYNLKTGRFIKQTSCGGSIGYVINGKFRSLKSLRPLLKKPVKSNLPF